MQFQTFLLNDLLTLGFQLLFSMSLISIIMPVHNTSKYLRECLDSIVNQTEQNWELLAVDDYSTDSSREILYNYAKADQRITILKNDAKGIIGALRLAFQNSSGMLITRMDSDDVMKPNKLSVLKSSLLTSGKKHLACGPVKYFADSEIGEGFYKYETWLNGLIKSGENFQDIYKECVIPSPSWMCYKEDLINCGGFDNDLYPEDYDLTFRFYKGNLECIPCNEVLHLWRDYPTRTSRTDPNYADNTFIDIKLQYFLALDHNKQKKIIIWGAGKKGKKIAQKLNEQNIDFDWICDNPNKIGHVIYGKKLLKLDGYIEFNSTQNIITIANPAAQDSISSSLNESSLVKNKDYFFFC
jgi:glycosyltransferase involved in cell wall biosynthesis